MAYYRLRDGRIARYVRLATFAKAVRPRPAFPAEAPVDSCHPGFASACGCSKQGVPSVFHSVPSHPKTSPNRKNTAGRCGDCVLPGQIRSHTPRLLYTLRTHALATAARFLSSACHCEPVRTPVAICSICTRNGVDTKLGIDPTGGLWPPSSSSSALREILFSSCSLRFSSLLFGSLQVPKFSNLESGEENLPVWEKIKPAARIPRTAGFFGLVVNLNIDAVDLHPFICPNEDVLCTAQHLGLNQLRPLRVHPNGHIRGGHLHLPGID